MPGADRIGAHGYRIGVAWQGDAAALGAQGKAFPAAALEGMARSPGARLNSLQKNAGAEQLKTLPEGMKAEAFYDLDSLVSVRVFSVSRARENGRPFSTLWKGNCA